jgi:hypothetical protein
MVLGGRRRRRGLLAAADASLARSLSYTFGGTLSSPAVVARALGLGLRVRLAAGEPTPCMRADNPRW